MASSPAMASAPASASGSAVATAAEVCCSEVSSEMTSPPARAQATAQSSTPRAAGRPVPVQALRRRLESAGDSPSWMAYLPSCWLVSDESSHSQAEARAQEKAALPVLLRGAADAGSPAFCSKDADTSASPAIAVSGMSASGGAAKRAGRSEGHWIAASEMSASSPNGRSPLPGGAASVLGSVWRLSREPEGCRRVQAAVEACCADLDVQLRLTAELKGRVWEAIRCPHANHVIQKCVTALHPEASQFIIDEVLQRGSGTVAGVLWHGAAEAPARRAPL